MGSFQKCSISTVFSNMEVTGIEKVVSLKGQHGVHYSILDTSISFEVQVNYHFFSQEKEESFLPYGEGLLMIGILLYFLYLLSFYF